MKTSLSVDKLEALPPKLIAISILFPIESSFLVAGLRLNITRILLLLFTPSIILRLFKKNSNGQYRFVLSDALVLLTGCWMIFAPAVVDGFGPALNHAGPTALEFCIPYYCMRAFLSRHGQATSFATLLCRAVAIVGLLAVLDPLSQRWIIRDTVGNLFGHLYFRPDYVADSYRLGILRATSTFDHPIILGFVSGVALLLAAALPMRRKRVIMFCCAVGAFAALSSAPLQAIILGFALLLYNRMFEQLQFRWLILICIGAMIVSATFVVSNSPIGFIISHLIYDPESGYYRLWTWYSVIDAVSVSPWYGLGFNTIVDETDINHSIDALWLVIAVFCGVPGAVLVALSMFGAVSLRSSGPKVVLTPVESKLGTTLGILIFLTFFISFTVDLLGASWLLISLIMGLRATIGELGHLSYQAVSGVPKLGKDQLTRVSQHSPRDATG